MIPFIDLKRTNDQIFKKKGFKIEEFLSENSFILGKNLQKFESNFSKYFEAKHSFGVGNGLDALSIALKSLNVKRGDEVIVPSHTFHATWLAVSNIGAIPIPVEISEDDFNIDINLIEKKITKKTKAIILVHLYGQPCNIDEAKKIAVKYKLKIIEDAAQAHGAIYKNKKIGSHSDAVCWSFYPTKNLGCFGDGGMISTNNDDLSEKINELRNYGSSKKYYYGSIGFNSRLDEIQAYILNFKIKKLNSWVQERNKIANFYLREIKNPLIDLPVVGKDLYHAWHLFVIKSKNRDSLIEFLNQKGIGTMIHYPIPPSKQKCYKSLKYKCSVAEKISNEVLSLPIYPGLKDSELKYIVESINNFKL